MTFRRVRHVVTEIPRYNRKNGTRITKAEHLLFCHRNRVKLLAPARANLYEQPPTQRNIDQERGRSGHYSCVSWGGGGGVYANIFGESLDSKREMVFFIDICFMFVSILHITRFSNKDSVHFCKSLIINSMGAPSLLITITFSNFGNDRDFLCQTYSTKTDLNQYLLGRFKRRMLWTRETTSPLGSLW